MFQNFSRKLAFSIKLQSILLLLWCLTGCLGNASDQKQLSNVYCAPRTLVQKTGSVGKALTFLVDPIVASGNVGLLPTQSGLGNFISQVDLKNLNGTGVLAGKYLDVRSNYFDSFSQLACDEWYGAFDVKNNFNFSYGDPRFQEGMTYSAGDQFRSTLDQAGYLQPQSSVRVVVHCMKEDNAYYSPERDARGNIILHRVCLGDSTITPGASYADDGVVAVHELQHATTGMTYSSQDDLNQFWYDEAGSANEAISDFAGLIWAAADVPDLENPLDPRVFSRWALRTFVPGRESTRGAHLCPAYDPDYPRCTSALIKYNYPDGLGWPYAKKSFSGPVYDAKNAYLKYSFQEEIHNAGVLLAGALYDVFDALRSNYNGSYEQAKIAVTRILLESLKHLPKPTIGNLSPVSFRGIASSMASSVSALGLSQADQTAVIQSLTQRGLVGGVQLKSDWATAQTGEVPQVKILDHPLKLKIWLEQMGSDSRLITHGIETGNNGKLDPGEVVALWFDIKNHSETTAGGVFLDVTIQPGDEKYISFLDRNTNIAGISVTQAQILYGKVNGTDIVRTLNNADPNLNIPIGNTYSTTNPFYSSSFRTALWVKVDSSAPHGTVVHFNVGAQPSNGQISQVTFATTIN